MNRKLWITAVLAGAALLLAGCASPTTETASSIVTGVTITGTGVTGSGGSKELTVTIGTPVDLGVTVTKAGTPSLVETWTSANATNVSVVQATGVVSGLVEDSTGVVVTVKVGTKSDTILVKVVKATPGLQLEFDTDKLEFQSIAPNMEKLAAYAVPVTTATPATVVKTGAVITAKNTDGTFKTTETFQGSSYLLYKTPLTGNFEVRAAVKITSATAASDKYSAQVGMFSTNAEGLVALDLKTAVVAKRKASTPNIRPLYTKSSESAVAAGTQTVTLDDTTLAQYHVLATKRVGSVITYEINGATSTVNIDADADANGTPDTTTGVWPTLAGAVKAGIGFSGVTAEIEGFSVTSLKADGTVDQVLYTSGSLPTVAFDVVSVSLAGPTGYETAAAIDLAGKTLPFTHQLTGAYVPASATVGNSLTYAVTSGSNVTVDNAGLVTINGTGTATVTATSGNSKTATYTFTLTDSSQVLKSVTIPSTLDISVGQSKTLSPVTYDPTTLSTANKVLTWSSNSTSILVDASTGAITVATGTAVGTTAKIKATSTNAVASNECTVTVVAPTSTTKTWNFQQLPTGWVTNTNSAAALPNVDYGQGLTLTTVTRTMKIQEALVAPSTGGTGFSVGALQPGGAGVFASLGTLTGNFSITINYCGAGTNNRYPAILVDGIDVTLAAPATASTGTSDGKTFTYNYVGVGGVVTLSSIGNALRVYDLSLTN